MSRSLVKNYVHIIFSTKHREPSITQDLRVPLFNYLGGICGKLDCQSVIVGGYVDHVHILCALSKRITVIDLLENIKSSSSKWVKTLASEHRHFYWQGGYGVFSVNPYDIDIVKRYIDNQEEHHRGQSFKDEYIGLLIKCGIEFDERYLWD